MTFPNLWGLLLLLAIPVLILIYIIKRENRERAVSGTYLWHLSDRFLKKRLPIKRVSVFLTFLLQLIILSLFAVSAMQPALTIGQLSGKIVVIDASASMLTEQDGVSRFDAAVEKAKDLAESGLCSSMTVIVASDTPACLVMGGSMSEALDALDNATCGYGGMDLYEAMKLVREASSRIGLAQVILYTDTEFADVENVEVVDMRRGEKNLAVTELTHSAGHFQGTLVSYGEDREVCAGLSIDGNVVETQTVSCPDGETVTVKFNATAVNFESATLMVDVEDALEIDNSFSVAGLGSDPVSVLVIGSEVLFFEKAFESLGNCEVTVKEKYKLEDDGQYDLYVFSSCVPGWDSIPRTGVTLGFTQYKGTVSSMSYSTILSNIRIMDGYCGQTGLTPQYDMRLEIDPIWTGMDSALQDVYVHLVNRYIITRGNSLENGTMGIWEPILGSESTGLNMTLRRILDNGARHYIFMFPISQSNLALTPAFPMLLQNACGLASPPPFEKPHYAVGETVELSLGENAQSPVMTTPDGTMTELADSAAFVPTYPGLYTLSYDVVRKPPENDPTGDLDLDSWFDENEEETDPDEDLRSRTASFFVSIPPSEYETYSGETIYYTNTFDIHRDGKQMTNTLLPFAAVLMTALLLFEWGYFYRGKH